MYTKGKTDRVTWQVTDTILGRSQAKLMSYVSYLEIHAPQQQPPVSQNSLQSTDYVHSLEMMWCRLQSKKTAQSTDSPQANPRFDQKFNQSKVNQTAFLKLHLKTAPTIDQLN